LLEILIDFSVLALMLSARAKWSFRGIEKMRDLKKILGCLCVGLAVGTAGSASANIVISPIFDSSITGSGNSAAIETGINNAIAEVESKILTPITVTIEFQNMGTGLGQSSTWFNQLTYSQYRSDLATHQTLSANDNTALASLPIQSANPVNNQTGNTMILTLPLLRAIGESVLGSNVGAPVNGIDSTIGLNTSIMNLSRTGTQNIGFYDLQSVAMHEISEALGAGGAGSNVDGGFSFPLVGSLDLFRYSAPGVRSFTTSAAATSYFSINGGTTNLSNFNQSGGGADYSDWAGSPPDAAIQVQDAFGTPGSHPDLSSNETTAYDVIGYNLTPEPASLGLIGICSIGLLARRRARQL
jgi:hypothetical protein